MNKLSKSFKKSKWYVRLEWLDANFLRLGSLFLLIFIPLYPKIPLLDFWQTWVNLRIEDLLLLFLALFFVMETIKKRTRWKSPLTIPIVVYWIIGGISALHAIIVFVPVDSNMFFHLVALHFFRQIEYMILFFIVVTSIRTKRDVKLYFTVFLVALVSVILYGFGQKYLGFCAFLTGNEEFSKGACQIRPPRITSTFAGHYDLGAYLVLAISLVGSMFLGISGWGRKAFYAVIGAGSFVLLLLTKSRASFLAVIVSILFLLIFHKKKWLFIPLTIFVIGVVLFSPGLSERYGNTFRVEPVVYDIRTNKPIALVNNFKNTKIVQDVLLSSEIRTDLPEDPNPTPTPFEELPLGSGFLDAPFVYRNGSLPKPLDPKLLYEGENPNVTALAKNYSIKQTIVYDISFTTRSQGQWPKAIAAFNKNMIIGAGYSSVGIAVDNNYLRRLAEVGIVGTLSYLSIFGAFFLVMRQSLRKKLSPFGRSFMIGMSAGVLGIMVNATLIDVFDASKVAYVMWMMIGVAIGLYLTSVSDKESIWNDIIAVVCSKVFAMVLIIGSGILIFYPTLNNFFIGDDFTWLKWAVQTSSSDIPRMFIYSEGFFYRPWTKILVYLLYQVFGMKVFGYHVVSLAVHIGASIMVYLIARFLTKRWLIALIAGLAFVVHPIHAESVLWMSGYSGLFAAFFYFTSLYLFMRWDDGFKSVNISSIIKSLLLYGGSILFCAWALISYELAITLPITIVFYQIVRSTRKTWAKRLVPTIPFVALGILYMYVRNVVASAHPLRGDYNYNLIKFPLNATGNILGYVGEMIAGNTSVPYYDLTRTYLRDNVIVAIILVVFTVVIGLLLIRMRKKVASNKSILFSTGWFIVALLPVMGLGNIAERYLYIPSAGFLIALSIGLFILLTHKAMWSRILFVILTILILLSYFIGFINVAGIWAIASSTSQNILETVTKSHLSFPKNSTLYFVNVPIRIQRAWVYPIGLPDAIYLHYRDDSIKVIRGEDIKEALSWKRRNPNTFVFVYTDDKLVEVDMFGTPVRNEETYFTTY